MSESNESAETPVDATTTTDPSQNPNDTGTLLTGAKPDEGDANDATKESEAEAKGEKDGAGDEPQLPEKYEFDIPEGMQVDEKMMAELDPVLRELKLSQEDANKLADFYSKAQLQQRDAWAAQVKSWQDEVKADPDIGGDKFQASIQTANEALNRFGASPEFIQFLSDFGLGNHPEMVKFMVEVGKATSEDRPEPATQDKGGRVSTAELFYGKPA